MTLHFPLCVNGHEIGHFEAQRIGSQHETAPDSIGMYRVEIIQHKSDDMPRKAEHFFVEHRYGDGAFALVQKAIESAGMFRASDVRP